MSLHRPGWVAPWRWLTGGLGTNRQAGQSRVIIDSPQRHPGLGGAFSGWLILLRISALSEHRGHANPQLHVGKGGLVPEVGMCPGPLKICLLFRTPVLTRSRVEEGLDGNLALSADFFPGGSWFVYLDNLGKVERRCSLYITRWLPTLVWLLKEQI